MTSSINKFDIQSEINEIYDKMEKHDKEIGEIRNLIDTILKEANTNK